MTRQESHTLDGKRQVIQLRNDRLDHCVQRRAMITNNLTQNGEEYKYVQSSQVLVT